MTVSFHLCQPGGGASCGACCGLYNFRDHSRLAVAEQLSMQTERLRRVPWEASAWHEAARELLAARRAEPMFSAVRVCPLLGFVDNERKQVGCLAHPLVTGGTDLRDCGVYRSSVCETFTCPSFGWLTDAQAKLVQVACADWYLYGLVITDVEFVRGCLRLLEWELAGPARPEVLMEQPEALAAIRRMFALKETAPRRGTNATVFGRFNRDADGEPVPRTVDYVKLGVRASPEDDVVLCLGYAPKDATELMGARELVRSHVKAVARALAA
ncbi:hypothetical protein MXAN_0796 [Myxococcus xanthus DK 1622]|uniref:Uncharacterized protein n=1 Tax=Myxococcus xanthus (strain DK1622) TaxID=246197 RepID=Q1DE64_MYXXD|nr:MULTISPECIES: hypothetical protein [Myxococcus]ABF90239.1 hypothetical protein MXAN_0796 [Myxococcus xanthus DK 1622]NOJ53604.1 hypothetical protein [Myxococcus xanthus]QPM80468.1 hypothetical protein I5Q59_03995 [Myxococcus xanthus]QVW69530.1 hypothetical protein JTM82_08285 [Myxococcus xanthus DZ2]UEO04343.1 hypothetical protein K1515_34525 [Myxococcus xanthus DZ2]